MRISVITASYNSESTLPYTLESFLSQTHPDKELVLVDGASSDRTLDVAASFGAPEIRVVSERDAGVFDAMNKGLNLFTGDAIGWLNSDDTFHDADALSKVAQALEDADVAFGDLLMVTDHQSKEVVREWKAGPFRQGAFQAGWQPPHPGFFVRRELALEVGNYDLSYRSAADYDWMLRALKTPGVRAAYVPHVLADFQMGGISTRDWRATLNGTLECLRSRRRHLNAPPIDAAIFLRLWRRLFQIRKLSSYYPGAKGLR
jgi:glycosyltransferase